MYYSEMLVAEMVFFIILSKSIFFLSKIDHYTKCTAIINYRSLNWIGFSNVITVMIIDINSSTSERWDS